MSDSAPRFCSVMNIWPRIPRYSRPLARYYHPVVSISSYPVGTLSDCTRGNPVICTSRYAVLSAVYRQVHCPCSSGYPVLSTPLSYLLSGSRYPVLPTSM
eukprot:2642648-Rhodomonas_salina.2